MYKTNYILYAAIIIFSMMSCNENDEASDTAQKEMLTAGSAKSWNITAETPEKADPECRPDAEFIRDNSWVFYRNGNFKFEGGKVKGNGKCSDFINFMGTWGMTDDNSLKILAQHSAEDPDIVFNGEVILFGSIQELTEKRLVLSRDGHTVTFESK